MFTKSSQFYNAIYSWKDYQAEAEKLHTFIQQHKRALGTQMLDVACGTGNHFPFLGQHYTIEGLDLDANMLALAHQKHPDAPLHQGDMVSFDLGRQFDVVVCLFSSIGYVKTVERLEQAVKNMARHVRPGGLLIIEPFFTPEAWQTGSVHATFVDQPDLKIARINRSMAEQNVAIMDMYYLVGTPQGVDHFVERHELALFTQDEQLAAFRAAGLEVTYDAEGVSRRGLYIGLQPEQAAEEKVS